MGNLACSVNDAAYALHLGRTSIYKLIHNGDLIRIKVGSRSLIRTDSIFALLEKEG